MCIIINMKKFIWDKVKNQWLKEHRGYSFEDILLNIAQGNVIKVLEHPKQDKYPDQKILLLNINSYVYCVPFMETHDAVYLITLYASRKYTKIYLGGERNEVL